VTAWKNKILLEQEIFLIRKWLVPFAQGLWLLFTILSVHIYGMIWAISMTTTISVPDRKYTCIDMTALYCHLCHCHTTYLQILLQVCNLTKTNLTIFPFHNILINWFSVYQMPIFVSIDSWKRRRTICVTALHIHIPVIGYLEYWMVKKWMKDVLSWPHT
jgi:hypothetical protein